MVVVEGVHEPRRDGDVADNLADALDRLGQDWGLDEAGAAQAFARNGLAVGPGVSDPAKLGTPEVHVPDESIVTLSGDEGLKLA